MSPHSPSSTQPPLTFLNLCGMMLARILATAVLAYLHLRLLMHVRLVTLQLSGQGKTRTAHITRVGPLWCRRHRHRSRCLHDNLLLLWLLLLLLLQIARRRRVYALVMIQQAHVSEHQAANVALEGRGRQVHLVDEGVVAHTNGLHVEAIAALVVRGYGTNGAHRVGLDLLQHVDVVEVGEVCGGGLLAGFVLFLVARDVHLLGLLLLRLLGLLGSLLLLDLLGVEHRGLLGLWQREGQGEIVRFGWFSEGVDRGRTGGSVGFGIEEDGKGFWN